MEDNNIIRDDDRLPHGERNKKEHKPDAEVRKVMGNSAEQITQYPTAPSGTTVVGTVTMKVDTSKYVMTEGTTGSESVQKIGEQMVVQDWRYGISKPRRIIIKGKISYDRD